MELVPSKRRQLFPRRIIPTVEPTFATYENMIERSSVRHLDPFSFDVKIEQQKLAMIQQFRDKEIL